MARIAGVDLPKGKKMYCALTYIYGIGPFIAENILQKANVDREKRAKSLTEDEVARIRDVIERTIKVEGDLRREISMNIKRLMDLGSYRGLRHRKGLPVRGQRTHSNANAGGKRRRRAAVRQK